MSSSVGEMSCVIVRAAAVVATASFIVMQSEAQSNSESQRGQGKSLP